MEFPGTFQKYYSLRERNENVLGAGSNHLPTSWTGLLSHSGLNSSLLKHGTGWLPGRSLEDALLHQQFVVHVLQRCPAAHYIVTSENLKYAFKGFLKVAKLICCVDVGELIPGCRTGVGLRKRPLFKSSTSREKDSGPTCRPLPCELLLIDCWYVGLHIRRRLKSHLFQLAFN